MIDTKSLKTGLLFDNRYTLVRPLSSDGGSADVWLARDCNTIDEKIDAEEGSISAGDVSTGLLVAIKVYRPKNALDIEGEQMFRDEYKIVHDCHHTNLLPPSDFSIFGDIPYLVFPYCEAGSSQKLIGEVLLERDVWKFIHDVASGLKYLHTNNPVIVHQDIKPANILIDKRGDFVITDFGISTNLGKIQDDFFEKERGTFAYMAPERFEDEYEPIPESDIWSFGATLFELLTKTVPFGCGGGGTQIEGTELQASLDGYASEIKKIILSCLAEKPQDRPTASQLIDISASHLQQSTSNRRLAPSFPRKGIVAAVSVIVLVVLGIVVYLKWPLTDKPVSDNHEEQLVAERAVETAEKETVEKQDEIEPSTEMKPIVSTTDKTLIDEKTIDPPAEVKPVAKTEPSVKPVAKTETSASKQGTVSLDYGIWVGEVQNGKPSGKGRITYTKPHDIGDSEHHEAQCDDTVEGTFQNGSWEGFPRWTTSSDGKVHTLRM